MTDGTATSGGAAGLGSTDAAGSSPRDRLLRAARDVVADDGLEGLTLRAIARRAGVSHGAPLRHFPTLASLLAAVAADGFSRLMATIDAVIADAERAGAAAGGALDPRERLVAAGSAYISFARAEPGIYAVMFRPDRVDVTDHAYVERGSAAFHQLVTMVAAAQADGWWPAERPEELAAALWAHVHGVADLTLHGAFPAVVGADAPERVPALFAEIVFGVSADDSSTTDPTTINSPHPGGAL
jgi:AcrR family transcriptional regulator